MCTLNVVTWVLEVVVWVGLGDVAWKGLWGGEGGAVCEDETSSISDRDLDELVVLAVGVCMQN